MTPAVVAALSAFPAGVLVGLVTAFLLARRRTRRRTRVARDRYSPPAPTCPVCGRTMTADLTGRGWSCDHGRS